MGSRNRNGEEEESLLNCDVGLGLKMQETAHAHDESSSSYPCKRTMVMPQFSPTSGYGGYGGGYGGSYGGGSLLGSDIYDVSLGSSAAGGAGGGIAMKAPFTALQWQELERQTMIYKYLITSNVVPPELLFPLIKNPSHISLSQSNTSRLDLKFSNGSDPEPWRCRRTDGKKWRCSRDVTPDQKYCERHAHKSRPRSRKHVEVQPHNTTIITKMTPRIPVSHSPSMSSAPSYEQTRNIMWLMRGGSDNTIPISTCNQQRQEQQLMQSSSRMGYNRDNMAHNKNMSFLHHQQPETQHPITLNPYMSFNTENFNSFLDPKINDSIQTTRHFIDGIKNEEGSSRKLPVSSLSLSMSGGNGIDEGLMIESDQAFKSQYMMGSSSVSWMNNITPGGPLGEALCLGIAGSTKGGVGPGAAASNLPSPHGYSNSSATSSCSKGSCEDGSHQFNFIG